MLHAADLALTERDPALPGLRLLLDAEAVADRLQNDLDRACTVEVRYVRYKPGENAVVALDVMVGGTVHTVHAKAHRADATLKLAKATERTAVPSALGPGRRLWSDLSVVVSFFPNDAKLKSLRRLGEADTRQRLLARVLPDRPDLSAEEPVVLRYKPERRWVGRFGDVVLKLHSASGFPSALQSKTALLSNEILQTAPILGRSVRHRALAYGWVEGAVLDTAIRDETTDYSVVAPVGAALAALHRQPVRTALPGRDAHVALRAAADAVAFTCPDLSVRVHALRQRIEQATPETPPVLIHGDFYAKQVLLSPGVPTVLDFDRLGLGAAAADLGTFLAHLERDRLRYGLSTHRIQNVRSALLEGYTQIAERPSDAALAAHTAAAIVGLAPHPFRFREPDWPQRTEALLDAAEAFLDAARPEPHSCTVDASMPALDHALNASQAEHALTRLQSEPVTVRTAHLRRHRMGRRALVEYEVETATGAPSRVLAKVRAKGLDRATLRLNEALWTSGFDARSDVSVPEPLGAWPEARAWLQRHVEGEDAAEALAGPEGEVVARRIAQALRRLHRLGPSPARRHTLADELAHLHARVPGAGDTHPELAPRLGPLLDACNALATTIPTVPPRPLHRDFYPDNLLVTPTQIVLLDLDLYALGDPALDAGNFVAHLMEQGLRTQGTPDALAAPIAAFVHAFAESDRQLEAVEAWTTLALVRHIAISTRIPSRRPLTSDLLALCEQRLLGTAVPPL